MDFGRIHQQGISLIEAIIAIAVAGILSALAIPSFNHLRASSAMAGSVNLFLAQLHLARSTAVTRERHITLCPASSPSTCDDDHKAWKNGYLIFEDSNKNHERDTDEQIISYEEKAGAAIRIFSSSQSRNRISFLPLGRAWLSNTTVRFCHPDHPDLNRAIIVSNNGRVRSSNKMADGSAITCP
ncbi:GspH/FimT family protein [Thiolapillus sp.]